MSPGRRSAAVAVLVTGVLLLVVAVGGLIGSGPTAAPAAPVAAPTAPADAAPAAVDPLARTISDAQARLREVPDDASTWARLGAAYVQQARITGDPSYYSRADGAVTRALTLDPASDEAMVAAGSLANARHDFALARDWALRAQQVNPASSGSYAVLNDALTQLGDYPGATAALQRLLDLRPDLTALTRASYDLEIHGRPAEAAAALERALAEASSPADIAFCRFHLGELAWNSGRLDEASRQYEAGAAADPAYPPLLEGRARVAAARGLADEAIRLYDAAVARSPLPSTLVQYGAYLTSIGRGEAAAEQFALVDAQQQLLAANGATDDLAVAEYAAERGDPAVALAAAQAEWERRPSVLVADALAWALHLSGRDAEALVHAREATRLGWRNATFLYHLGTIEAALGDRDAARAHLTEALAVNPHFSPTQAPLARRTLAQLGTVR